MYTILCWKGGRGGDVYILTHVSCLNTTLDMLGEGYACIYIYINIMHEHDLPGYVGRGDDYVYTCVYIHIYIYIYE